MIAEFVAAVAVDDYDGDGDLEVFAPMLDDATLTLMATAEWQFLNVALPFPNPLFREHSPQEGG